MKKIIGILILTLILGGLLVGTNASTTQAADHLDAPLVMDDSRLDINDIYAFQSPTNPDNTVLIMTLNPLAGVQNPTTLKPLAAYEFKIDNDGDAREELTYRLRFGHVRHDGSQKLWLFSREEGERSRLLALGRTEQDVPVAGGGRLRVGLHDDPFFFDLAAFNNGLRFCETNPAPDFFAGLNVTAIILEVPSHKLGGSDIGVWARTRDLGEFDQFDRMGRPAINTVFIPSANKDAFNAGKPKNDQADFRADVVNTLLALGNDEPTANALADILLPDILTVDTSDPAGFLNGRAPANDVIDTELTIISGGAITTDCVDANDVPFPDDFPYLAAPHT